MFVKKREWERLAERVIELEEDVVGLKRNLGVVRSRSSERYYLDDLWPFLTDPLPIWDKVNALAEHLGVRFDREGEKPARIVTRPLKESAEPKTKAKQEKKRG